MAIRVLANQMSSDGSAVSNTDADQQLHRQESKFYFFTS